VYDHPDHPDKQEVEDAVIVEYPHQSLEDLANGNHEIVTSCIINILRILKKNNPNDGYLESYYWHMNKNKEKFFDMYHFLWWLGSNIEPQRVLEIGCRTGMSICQLLSAYRHYNRILDVVLCDNFSEIGSPEIVLNNLKYLNIPTDRVQFKVGSSLDELPKLIEANAKFDYILVDGCHDKPFALADLNNAKQLIDLNGYIAFDDLTPDGCSLQDVWDQFKGENSDKFEFFENKNGKGLGVAKKKEI
jgi:predicted O-methyltransferase YrrM